MNYYYLCWAQSNKEEIYCIITLDYLTCYCMLWCLEIKLKMIFTKN